MLACAWPAGWRPSATTVACSSSTCVTRSGQRPTCPSRASRRTVLGQAVLGKAVLGQRPWRQTVLGSGYLQGDHRARVVQLVCHPGGPAFEPLSRLRLESVVSVSGQVVARPPDTVNPKLLTGEIEVDVGSVEVLSSSEVLPFPVERDTDVGEEARLTYRYLDMRRGPLAERLAKRARFCQLVRSHLSGRGFLEVQTPVLTASSPEGARDYLVPSRLYPGEFYALPQAPQQFKQLLMVGGVERYFQIAPCFRDEASRADRSPGEFYQIDLEMAFATQEDVFGEVELLFSRLVTELSGKRSPAPYPRLSFADAVARYGTDKPDLRFGLEVVDLTEKLGGRTELPMFSEAPAKGHVIRGLARPRRSRPAPQLVRRVQRGRQGRRHDRELAAATRWRGRDEGCHWPAGSRRTKWAP